ncbi:MAG: RIP metalloprotease RseP [Gammaproteobacteria bacterium]|nr:RIP metalloprotease RseP [Gammaproteobacteria bacterium]
MVSFLYSVVGFICAIAILVTIHEFGHYWVAKKLGVKVLRFSVGFGKPLWKKVAGEDQTEYVIGAIPLGGYVKMLDEREGDVDEKEKHRAFTQKSVYSRFAIVAAGPLFNFIFAILAYWLLFMAGVSGVKPLIGDVELNSIAAKAGLQSEQQIIAVNDKPVQTWATARFSLLEQSVGSKSINVTVLDKNNTQSVKTLDVSQFNALNEQKEFLDQIGLSTWRPKIAPVIAAVSPDGAAARAGFKAGDKIYSMNGDIISDVKEWIRVIREHAGRELSVVVLRDGNKVTLHPIPDLKTAEGETYGFLGVSNKIIIPPSIREKMMVTEIYNPVDAFVEAISRTGQMSWLTLKVMGKLVIGEASIKNLSGPITIAEYAGTSAQMGLNTFLTFMALISISLGVLNLLPIPVLDGGHLFYYLIEMIKGSAVSEQFELMGQKVGLFVLLCFMSIAIYNDILRLVD